MAQFLPAGKHCMTCRLSSWLHSQMMLLDSGTMGLSMGLQAVTPAGLEAFGLAEGPTILTPNFAWFYETSGGNVIQGFVGKNLRTRPGWSESLERDVRYGM